MLTSETFTAPISNREIKVEYSHRHILSYLPYRVMPEVGAKLLDGQPPTHNGLSDMAFISS